MCRIYVVSNAYKKKRVGLAGQGLGGGLRASVPEHTYPSGTEALAFPPSPCPFCATAKQANPCLDLPFFEQPTKPQPSPCFGTAIQPAPYALVAGEGWGGRGLDGSSKQGEGWGLAVRKPGKGWLAWQFHRRGQGLGRNPRASVPVGVLFFERGRVPRDAVAVCLVLFGGQGRVGLAGPRARGGVQGLRFRGGRW